MLRIPVNIPRLLLLAVAGVGAAFAFQALEPDLATQARAELYAARYDKAAGLYRTLLAQQPAGDCYYGLTRALLKAHRAKEAYAVAEEAEIRLPQAPGSRTAAGLAMFRKGELAKAEIHFRAALKLDPNYPGALSGLAAIHSVVSQARAARGLLLQAYAANPGDPTLMQARANTLKGDEHIAALEQVLALVDPDSEEARGLRAHIASDRALHGRKVRRLISPYEPARIKLMHITSGPTRVRGFGMRVQVNESYTGTLLLDTGASGISLSPKAIQKAGLELLSDQSFEVKGIGDKKPEDSFSYLASEVRFGNVRLADHPISVFRAARDSDVDGIIGADVFQRFVVTLDFPAGMVELQPYPAAPSDDPEDAKSMPPGFHRIVRAGNHMMIPTSVNESPSKLFLIDSGSSSNLIDAEAARDFTGVHGDSSVSVRGLQGKVDKVSRASRITLVFGGFRQENPDLIAISLEKPSDSMGMAVTGVLGMPVLGQLKLTIDYREGAIRLER